MKTDLNYCIVLSSEQLAYLAGSKYGIDRMKILHRLIEAVVLKEIEYSMKGFSTTLQVGQAILSEVDLSCKLGYDKKTISRVLDKMNQLGIVASTQSNRTSVHTLECISAWMENGNRIDNPFYVRIKDRQEEGENTSALSDDAKPLLPTPPLEENVSNSNDCSQSEVMNEGCISDTVFPLKANYLLYQTKGNYSRLLPPPFCFGFSTTCGRGRIQRGCFSRWSDITILDMAVEPMFSCGVLQEVPMSHKFATLIRTT